MCREDTPVKSQARGRRSGARDILARRRRYSDTVTPSLRALERFSRASRSVTLNVSDDASARASHMS